MFENGFHTQAVDAYYDGFDELYEKYSIWVDSKTDSLITSRIAQSFFYSGNFRDALNSLTKAVKSWPGNSRANYLLASMLHHNSDYPSVALKYIDDALNHNIEFLGDKVFLKYNDLKRRILDTRDHRPHRFDIGDRVISKKGIWKVGLVMERDCTSTVSGETKVFPYRVIFTEADCSCQGIDACDGSQYNYVAKDEGCCIHPCQMGLKLLSSDPWSRNRPKRVQFNDVIAALQSLLRVEGYDSTWVEAEALKIERFFTEFGCRLKCSYVYDDCCRAVNPKDIARTLKRFLPLPSEEDLERRVNEEGCSGSMVRLAVALKWGLHRPGRPSSADYALSSEYFRRSAAADNPVACVNMAYDCYTSLLSIDESDTRIVVDITTPIPPRRWDCPKHAEMWSWLERCIRLHHISAFLFCRIREAQRTKNWQPSNLALGMLQRYDEKNTIISIDNVREFHNKCFYCRARLSEPYTRCPTCKLATYCGVACQVSPQDLCISIT